MPIEAYLVFDGNCREAVLFYKEVFNTHEPKFMTFGDSPDGPEHMQLPEMKDLIMHTRLVINGTTVMFSDNFPGMEFTVGNNITLAYVSDDAEELKAVYSKLKEGGRVDMELQETFWSKLYGQVTDRFGIQWQLNYGDGNVEM
ncbi:VOC family protein [Paenibacillus montaniterrae]|uniref:VOC family protein n=1 Tax=Paenibacillus montaniterrae TaxID=429341 RepID=A0A919YSL9_9BACL|nr:VOC family protein [Paenibacillus montaniterrae]GIP18960.1 VOC family protein [Paenibacillus montaniterrae]